MLENVQHVFTHAFDNIVWLYTCHQPLYDELKDKIKDITFIEGIPASLCDDQLLPPHKNNLLVIDDLMTEASSNTQVQMAFTKFTHHRNLSVLYLVQNLFFQGKSCRTINLNANYMLLFKSPRDKQQIRVLASQMFPGNVKYFMECFDDATAKKYGFLLVDLKPQTPDDYRLRSGLFPWEWPAVYLVKKNKK